MLPKIRVCDSINRHIAERRNNVPNIKSQIKRVRTDAEKNKRNTSRRTRVKNSVKRFNAAVEAGDVQAAEEAFRAAEAEIDRAERDGIFHKNNAARKTATLARILDGLRASQPAPAPAEKAEKAEKTEKAKAPKAEKTEKAEKAEETEKPKRTVRKKAEKTENA